MTVHREAVRVPDTQMTVRIRRRGEETWTEFSWPTMQNTESSSLVVARRAIEMHDPHGDGKVHVDGWTYRYVCGHIVPPKHC